jgi:hypothetical protein
MMVQFIHSVRNPIYHHTSLNLLTGTVMLKERRREERYVINRVAKFRLNPKARPRECLVTDISKLGARLFVDGIDMPEQFELFIEGLEGTRRECTVMWRLGGEIGVAFVGNSDIDAA